jgi:hypothetical protein
VSTHPHRYSKVSSTVREGLPGLTQPFEDQALQRRTGFLIIPWSLVRIQAGPVLQINELRCHFFNE